MQAATLQFMIDRDAPEPLYVQLADVLTEQIRTGGLAPRRMIPSETTLAQTYGVNRLTARKAVRLLRQRGLIATVVGKGSYVRPREQWPDEGTDDAG